MILIAPRASGCRRRRLGLAVAVFAVSTSLPVLASCWPGPLPPTLPVADIILAPLVLVSLFLIDAGTSATEKARFVERSFRIVRILAALPLLLFLLFLVVGNSIAWSVLLPGLGWRGWALVQVLPAALAWAREDAAAMSDPASGGK